MQTNRGPRVPSAPPALAPSKPQQAAVAPSATPSGAVGDARAAALLSEAIRQKAAGRAGEAIRLFQAALALEPGSISALVALGELHRESGRPAEAADYYGRAIALGVNHPGLHNNLGLALMALGRAAEAAASFRRAASLDRSDPAPLSNLGDALTTVGNLAAAEAVLEAALKLDPALAAAHLNLGNARRKRDRPADAIRSYRTATALAPDNPRAHGNLGLALAESGRIGEAVPSLERAVELAPGDPVAASNLCYALCYDAGRSPEDVLARHRRWNDRFGPRGRKAPPPASPDPGRRLRIGYVSPDFRSHPVGAMMAGPLTHHDRAGFQAICYSAVARPDAVTQRLQAAACDWRSVVGMNDEALAAAVRADAIDILVDLSGHMAGGRLAMFSLRPAPVQLGWAGYPFSSGSDALDAAIVDAHVAPDGAERLFSERLLRLPRVWTSYTPPAPLPEAGAAARGGEIVFGSFNNPQKIDGATVALWARLVAALPRARLALKAPAFEDAAVRADFARRFAAAGLAPERLGFAGASAWEAHLAAMADCDVALDPLPYTGATTTIECLLMGTPVVTRAGEAYYRRHAVGMLEDVGIGDLVAADEAAYVARALALAEDGARRARLRRSLRGAMLAAPVSDAAGFTRALEDAYRLLWRDACRRAC
ncbi:MAG: tetratricopeptide repeat protein [Alphaproteobacteria bacterium]|nr:tetratricopeptide repeat protein [Alphaproteobacteria bacterium]